MKPLARFLYGHLLKRIGDKSLYMCRVAGFLTDIGFGHLTRLPPKRQQEHLKRMVFPALNLIKGQAYCAYELDGQGNFVFFHS
jgi:hypothetical protein